MQMRSANSESAGIETPERIELPLIWNAVAERSGDTAFGSTCRVQMAAVIGRKGGVVLPFPPHSKISPGHDFVEPVRITVTASSDL
jgi:hypothetical protein